MSSTRPTASGALMLIVLVSFVGVLDAVFRWGYPKVLLFGLILAAALYGALQTKRAEMLDAQRRYEETNTADDRH